MISQPNITEQRHSPKEHDQYMKGNLSLQDLVDGMEELAKYQAHLAKEAATVSAWQQEYIDLFNARLLRAPAA